MNVTMWICSVLVILSIVPNIIGYLIIVNHDSNPDTEIFDGTLSNYKEPTRKYYMNVDKSASFVEKLVQVNSSTGSVTLKRRLACDGIEYPNVFTLYIDSTCNDIYEYVSIPLKVYIHGCETRGKIKETSSDYFSTKISALKQMYSESLVSYALPGTSVPAFDPLWETCFRKSQLVMGLENYVIPRAITSQCRIHYVDVMDSRLSIETSVGDLVAAYDFCTPLDPPWKVKIVYSYECDENTTTNIVYPAVHYVKVVFWHRKEKNEIGRVRRDLQNGGSTDSKIPQFEKPLYVAPVLEEQPPGTNVCTVHAKSAEGGEISYQMIPLLDGRSHAMFNIDSESGVVTTSVSLDREQLDVHYFRIQAVDLSNRPYSATTTLQINVLDVNDHAPIFEVANGEYEASVRESVPVGSIVTTVRATDKDIGRNGEIEYEIRSIDGGGIGNTSSDTFNLDSVTGVLTTRAVLDRETTEVYTIIITATDRTVPATDRKSATGTIVVKVLDENDNYPQFAERTYTVFVAEDLNPNLNPKIATIKATDADQGQNAAIRYAIIGGNTQGQFSIDSQNGDISLDKPLDYETMKNYRLVVRAQDGGTPSRSNTTQVLVNVKDVNDNAPRFYASLFQESVLENVPVDYSIVRVQAYDADEGENADLTYTIGERDVQGTPASDLPIAVNEKTGWIHTTKPLDREVNSKFQFQIIARDNGNPPKSATTSVVINIQDVNDNDPVFNPKNYEAVVSESELPGTPVANVVATDPDESPRLHYEIANGNTRGRFAITTQNGKGLITVTQPLDYKQEKRFVLTIRAVDSGGRFDTATVYVNISDANNFPPVFDNAPYTASIFEDVPVGTTVLVVAASDNDVGQNAQITYSLASGIGEAPEFTINPQTGAIITTKPLDREVQSGYLLTVTAKDGGVPQLSDTTDVEISVSDINDNAPVFLKSSYTGSVSEDSLVGTSVLQVAANDIDTGLNSRIRYALKEDVGAFVIDPTSGVIRTATPLDRESIARYEIHALAIDRGTPPMSSSVLVTVRIEDVNDSPPAFESDKLTFYIAENSPIGSVAGILYAKDLDEGQNAEVTYSLIGGEDVNSFSLSRRPGSDKAEILTLIELDYESSKKKYDLVVRAASPPLRNDARVEILVTDVNDNAPQLKDFHVIFNNFKDHFPVGPFSRVPAFDADVSDKLRYHILSGNNANLIHLNESTGQLTLSPQLNTNVQKTAFIEVSVSDGINEVKATMQLLVRLVTDEMLYSSVTVRLNDMTQEVFLSPLLSYFIEGLSAIIPCPKENIYILSILDDTDVSSRILNVSFSARKPEGSFYSSQFLQEKVYLNRMTLAKLSTLQVLPFDDNLCLREPCLNFEQCLSILKFGNASEFIHSDSVLFRPIYPVSTFVCQCPFGYTGSNEHYLCDTEVNLCYSNPCQHGGTCKRKEGGYTCLCPSQYTGEKCEIDLLADKCQPGVCHSGSTCVPLTQGGFVCDDCAPNSTYDNYDRICQLRGRSFSKNSFLTFPSLKQRNRLYISLRFATLEESGLLLYNGRYNELHDFIALEIVEGGQAVEFSFSLGSDVTRVSASLPGGVNDGNWHTVVVSYHNKTATVSLDGCDTTLTIKYGQQLGYTCANSTTQVLEPRCAILTETCHRFLDLTGPLQIGGLPILPSSTSFQVKSRDFVGCIADVHIDHKLLDFNSFVADNGTVIGCLDKHSHCSSQPCQNGGTCIESWGTFLCECTEGFSGKDCSQNVGPSWRFNGDGTLSFNPLLRPIQLPWSTSLSIRTLQQDAFIMCIQMGQGGYALVTLDAGYLVYIVDGQTAVLTTSRLNDGLWHRIEITWLAGGGVRLSTDYGKRSVNRIMNAKVQGLYIGKVTLGKMEDPKAENIKLLPFSGCVQDIRIGSSQTLQRPTEVFKVIEGCGGTNPCETGKCPSHSDCIATWEKHTCKCHSGYVGPACNHVCETNPCANGAHCEAGVDTPRGYRCVCTSELYTGEYCEIEVEQSCPISWWGHPVCGPCNCPTQSGYNPDCNKTSGECVCKENHYKPPGSDVCLPCDCYPTGSIGSSCDFDTGQCKCRPRVVGRRCEACPNGFAEVTFDGCAVVYDGCPRNFADGIWWRRTEFGKVAVEDCPRGSQGKASRLCDNTSEGWQNPDIFNCTSDSFTSLRRRLVDLESEGLQLNTFVAIETADSIKKACNNSDLLYGADILIAEQIIQRLLNYEKSQSGLNLTHSQDKDYMQNVILGVSRVLDMKEKNHWDGIKKLINETPETLLYTLWEYLMTLATNQHDTYTDPFEIVTSNIAFGLDIVTSESLFGYESDEIQLDASLDIPRKLQEKVVLPDTSSILESSLQVNTLKTGSQVLGLKSATGPTVVFPKYNNYLMDKSKFDTNSQIMIPIDLLGIRTIKEGEIGSKEIFSKSDNAVVGYAQYKNIGSLIPLRYDETVSKRYGVDLIVGSPVISVIVAINQHTGNEFKWKRETDSGSDVITTNLLDLVPLPVPVRLRIWLNHDVITPLSNPQCVRWTNIRGYGEWTRSGCLTVVPDIPSHKHSLQPVLVNCTCNQLSTYAVLVDGINGEYVAEFTFIEDIASWIAFTMAITALALACILLSLLRANTNSSSICISLTFCLLMTQCLFLFAMKSQMSIVSNEFSCKIVAMGLHYLWLSVMCWSLVSSLHLYRMLTEMRDVNHGQMGFYHSLGYGLPAIIVGLSVGVRADQYGNYFFCWLSLYESVVWSLVGPVCVLVICKLIVLLLSLRAAFTLKDHVAGYGNLRTLLWLSVVSLPLLVAVWMLELLAGTERDVILTYLLCIAIVVQAWFTLCGYCFGNARIRASLHRILMNLFGGKVPPIPDEDIDSPVKSTSHSVHNPVRSSLAYRNAGVNTFEAARRQIGISTSSTTSRSTNKTCSSPYRSDVQVRNTSTSTSNYEPSASDGTSALQPVQHTSDSDSEGSAERQSLDLASSHSSDDEESSRSRRKRRNVGVSTKPPPHMSSGYLPNVIEDSIAACSGSLSRMPTVQPPSHLNVIANSQLFPNLKSYRYSPPRWNGQIMDSQNIVEEDEPYPHRWNDTNMSDGENNVIASHMRFESKPPMSIGRKYLGESSDPMHHHMSDMEYDNGIDTGPGNIDEKYSFPYTAEEDHCGSPYMNILRGAELPVRKLSASHSPNLDLCRMNGNRSSMRSIDRVYDGAEDGRNMRSMDICGQGGRGLHSSHSSIDRKRALDEVSIHSAGRNCDPMHFDGGLRGTDETSVRSFNLKRGSDLSLRSDDPNRYGRMPNDLDRESRRGSDASITMLGGMATLPMQRRPFYASNEYGIANISESEKDTNEETRV
ncbi:protocadherin-like wing polarity protein stan [Planococcus citri]|uniref:protocadherin-like wing polarity protein stan n=1 Tax=Planococcus citri TaxID=170843 RepID=UPI0031F95B5A